MALIPTHLRFALDVAKYHSNPDPRPYLSGTIYPDSRWTTGIDRVLTHDAKFLSRDFPTDDFTLGWHIHCVCDELQKEIHHPILDEFPEYKMGNKWVLQSVAKVIQDMNDLQQIDPVQAFGTADLYATPNGENPDDVKAFCQAIRETYTAGGVPTPDDYGAMWRRVGLNPETTEELLQSLTEKLVDPIFVRQIQDSYKTVLNLYLQRFVQNAAS